MAEAVKSRDNLDSSYWSSHWHQCFTLSGSTHFSSISSFSSTALSFRKKLFGFDFTGDDVLIISLNELDKHFVAESTNWRQCFWLID